MKSFLKYTLATITGIFLTILIFMFLLVIFIASSTSKKPAEAKPNSILYMKLDDRIVERAVENPFYFLPTGLPSVREMGLNDIIDNINKAKKDNNISGIYLELSNLNAGTASTTEIRNALGDFKESGKFIIAFADLYTRKSYYLASIADSVFLSPEGYFFFTGIARQIMFYKEAMDKLGIEAQIIKHGEYKSFVEPYTKKQMSPENREQILAWSGSIWNNILQGISEERGLDPDRLDNMTDKLDIFSPKAALKEGLVDGLVYKDQVINCMKELTGTDEKKDLHAITLRRYTSVPAKRDYKGFAKDKIAVIYAHGDVVVGNTGEGSIASERISRAIRQARRDSSVKAIVIRVNSGGGSSLAADIIWREVKLASETKPVVASMGDVAASGGYYFLAPADKILAQPTTITGSIGVFAIVPNVQSLMNNKLGINIDVAKTNQHADFGTPFRSLTQTERAVLRKMVEDNYKLFVDIVADGREMSHSGVDEIARGRVWSGEDAIEIGLVDAYGGLQDAIRIASEMAGLEKYRIQSLPKLEDPLDLFLRELTANARTRMVRKELGEYYTYFEYLRGLKNYFGVQARLPFRIEDY